MTLSQLKRGSPRAYGARAAMRNLLAALAFLAALAGAAAADVRILAFGDSLTQGYGLPAPTNYGEDYRQEFDAVFRDLAEAHGAIFYPSFLAGMGEGRSMREVMVLMQPDGIHPNAEGVAAIVDHIGPRVLDLVAAARAAGA